MTSRNFNSYISNIYRIYFTNKIIAFVCFICIYFYNIFMKCGHYITVLTKTWTRWSQRTFLSNTSSRSTCLCTCGASCTSTWHAYCCAKRNASRAVGTKREGCAHPYYWPHYMWFRWKTVFACNWRTRGLRSNSIYGPWRRHIDVVKLVCEMDYSARVVATNIFADNSLFYLL